MTSSQEKWLFNHLGHTEDVNLLYYRTRSSVIERVDMAKLCLMMDLNHVSEFAGKALPEVQFDGTYILL